MEWHFLSRKRSSQRRPPSRTRKASSGQPSRVQRLLATFSRTFNHLHDSSITCTRTQRLMRPCEATKALTRFFIAKRRARRDNGLHQFPGSRCDLLQIPFTQGSRVDQVCTHTEIKCSGRDKVSGV